MSFSNPFQNNVNQNVDSQVQALSYLFKGILVAASPIAGWAILKTIMFIFGNPQYFFFTWIFILAIGLAAEFFTGFFHPDRAASFRGTGGSNNQNSQVPRQDTNINHVGVGTNSSSMVIYKSPQSPQQQANVNVGNGQRQKSIQFISANARKTMNENGNGAPPETVQSPAPPNKSQTLPPETYHHTRQSSTPPVFTSEEAAAAASAFNQNRLSILTAAETFSFGRPLLSKTLSLGKDEDDKIPSPTLSEVPSSVSAAAPATPPPSVDESNSSILSFFSKSLKSLLQKKEDVVDYFRNVSTYSYHKQSLAAAIQKNKSFLPNKPCVTPAELEDDDDNDNDDVEEILFNQSNHTNQIPVHLPIPAGEDQRNHNTNSKKLKKKLTTTVLYEKCNVNNGSTYKYDCGEWKRDADGNIRKLTTLTHHSTKSSIISSNPSSKPSYEWGLFNSMPEDEEKKKSKFSSETGIDAMDDEVKWLS